MKRWKLIWLGLLLLMTLACTPNFWFQSTSVCSACSQLQLTIEFQLPLLQLTYWRSTSVQATPLSDSLQKLGVTQPHQHVWAYCQGGGNGVACALGESRHVRATVTSPEVARFFEDIHRHHPSATAELRDLAGHPQHTRDFHTLRFLYPANGIQDENHLRQWLQENREDLGQVQVLCRQRFVTVQSRS